MAKYQPTALESAIKSEVKYKTSDALDHIVKTLEDGGFLGEGVKMTDMMKDQISAIFDEILNGDDGFLDAVAKAVSKAVSDEHSKWQKLQQVKALLDSPAILVNPGIPTAGSPSAQTTVAPGSGNVVSPSVTGAPGMALPE